METPPSKRARPRPRAGGSPLDSTPASVSESYGVLSDTDCDESVPERMDLPPTSPNVVVVKKGSTVVASGARGAESLFNGGRKHGCESNNSQSSASKVDALVRVPLTFQD